MLVEHMDYISTDNWRFCCIARTLGTCDVVESHPLKCLALISHTSLKAFVWIFAFCIFSLNALVFVYQLQKMQKVKTANNLLLITLSMADISTSLYQGGIAFADNIMHGTYVLYEEKWKKSLACHSLVIVSTVSMEMSLVSMTVLSGLYAFTLRFRRKPTFYTMTIVSSVLFCLCLLLAVMLLLVNDFNRNGLCHFIQFSFKAYSNEFYTAVLIVTTNGLLLTCLIGSLLHAISLVQASIKMMSKVGQVTGGVKKSHTIRLLWMKIISNLLCWLPMLVVLIACILEQEMGALVNEWMILFILPISCLINPVIYTLRGITMKKNIWRGLQH